MGRMAKPARNNGLRPQVSAVRPTSRANGNITSCAAMMQVDIATALGLVAAIPAVVMYNTFSRWIATNRALQSDASAEVMLRQEHSGRRDCGVEEWTFAKQNSLVLYRVGCRH